MRPIDELPNVVERALDARSPLSGFVRYANAPRDSAGSGSSSPVRICTGDVARERILLELAEHGPAEHVGQADVEAHRVRAVLAREHQRVRAARRDESL